MGPLLFLRVTSVCSFPLTSLYLNTIFSVGPTGLLAEVTAVYPGSHSTVVFFSETFIPSTMWCDFFFNTTFTACYPLRRKGVTRMWVCLSSLPREGRDSPLSIAGRSRLSKGIICRHAGACPKPWSALAPLLALGVQGGRQMRRWVGSDPGGNRSGVQPFIEMQLRFMEPLQLGLSLC